MLRFEPALVVLIKCGLIAALVSERAKKETPSAKVN
jgi:hypothetical protein